MCLFISFSQKVMNEYVAFLDFRFYIFGKTPALEYAILVVYYVVKKI